MPFKTKAISVSDEGIRQAEKIAELKEEYTLRT